LSEIFFCKGKSKGDPFATLSKGEAVFKSKIKGTPFATLSKEFLCPEHSKET